ncbi:MAG: ABC transporter ATP-binding protein [Solirubrobacterales bacterium]
MTVLTLDHITVQYGGLVAVDAVSLSIGSSQVSSVVGPNGAGKSTMLGAVSGAVRPAGGTVAIDGQKLTGGPGSFAHSGIRRTFQTPRVMLRETLLENVMVAAKPGRHDALLSDLFDTVRRDRRERSHAAQAEAALERVGLGGRLGELAGALSYGQVRLLELARALAGEPQFLLLDEPAAGLNDAETELLGVLLQDLAIGGIGVVLVEHNLKLVTTISEVIHVLNFGQLIASGRPEVVVRDPAVIEAYTGEHV